MTEASDFASRLFEIARTNNGENITLELGGVPVFVVQDLDSAHHVLRHNAANYLKSMEWFRQALGASRFTENGSGWNLRQALSQSYLSRFDREKTVKASIRLARKALQKLNTKGEEQPQPVDDAVLRNLAAAVMLEVFFDVDLDSSGVELEHIAYLVGFGSEYSFVPHGKKIAFSSQEIASFMDIRYKVLRSMQVFRQGDVPQESLLGKIRKMDAEGTEGFRLEHEMTMFFAAASETTAATLGWAMFALSRWPETQDELRKVSSRLPDLEECCWEDIETCEPLRNFVLEVLRMFPSTPVIARRAVVPDGIGDKIVGADEQVLISLVGIQHNRNINPDPWQLDIKRPPSGGANFGNSISFSTGPRVCGGTRFALTELMSVLLTFIREAEFSPTSMAEPKFLFRTQLMNEGGQPVRVSMRISNAVSGAEAGGYS
ncbi:cytochrome P450 [Ochrobactrum sp. Q0168]|uniref:cytochrome P450 n=1 Tax=Ochrobactrum sp. Q0168 TaxID=2793241 RepID=UPI0018EC465F|nr:cytochrome P450 [Ochrobactrum sp. Q0168]